LISLSSVILEGFAGLAINYCHDEDLIHFYWGFYFLLSLSPCIATSGLFFLTSYAPKVPWNTGFGTPVLVFAAAGHAVVTLAKNGWRYLLGKKQTTTEPQDSDYPW
jgi:hypothetical protein